jgi:urease accessory protein
VTGDLLPFLGALQLTDSAFPSGRYTLSHGLEAYVQAGQLRGERDLEALIADLLRFGIGPSDGVALANAHRATCGDDDTTTLAAADERLTATKLTREARVASVRTGRQLLVLASTIFAHPVLSCYADRVQRGKLPGNHAVALGLATAAVGMTSEHALAAELYAFCVGCTGAAVRLAVIDHRGAQRLAHALKPVVAEVVRENVGKGVNEIASGVPLVDVMAMHHERADGRLFIT